MEVMHIGVPIKTPMEGESYAEGLKLHIVGPETSPMNFEYLRFEDDTPMHKDIVNNLHIAYKVEDINTYLDKYEVLQTPLIVSDELTIAFVKIDGVVIELMQFA